MKWTDDAILKSIMDGLDDGLIYLYRTYQNEFRSWAGARYHVDHELAGDAFQEAIIAFRFNVIHNKLGERTSTLKTYLFSIGKNKLLDRLKKSKHEVSSDDLSRNESLEVQIRGQQAELNDRQELVRSKIKSMFEPCKSILKMFYYMGYSMEVIAARMSYKNENVAKSQKLRCLKKLKEAVHNTN